MKSTGAYRVVTPEAFAEELRAMGDFAFAMLHPMVGGLPPERAWESLRLFDERRISSAEAAQDLGLTRVQVMELARKRGVSQYDYTAEDLTTDLADLEAISA